MMTVGSLFSGIGGFDLGLERAGYEIIWQVENNEFCRHVLKKHWPAVPCHYDITTIDWEFVQPVDLVCGGFPCQPFSCAGKQRGAADDRYLWPEVVRCLATVRPTWFLGENVPGLLHVGIDQVLSDLEALGYQTAVLGIPACGVDAPHIRQRLWILAHTECVGSGSWGTKREGQQRQTPSLGDSVDVADATSIRRNGYTAESRGISASEAEGRQQQFEGSGPSIPDAVRGRCEQRESKRQAQTRISRTDQGAGKYWLPEPELGRVAHGIPNRVHRLKGLGNAVVPAIVETLGKMILQAEQVGHL